MGESVSEGIVSRWLKAVGDSVDEGEPLVEVTTDKVDVEVPAPATGRAHRDRRGRGRDRRGRRDPRGDRARAPRRAVARRRRPESAEADGTAAAERACRPGGSPHRAGCNRTPPRHRDAAASPQPEPRRDARSAQDARRRRHPVAPSTAGRRRLAPGPARRREERHRPARGARLGPGRHRDQGRRARGERRRRPAGRTRRCASPRASTPSRSRVPRRRSSTTWSAAATSPPRPRSAPSAVDVLDSRRRQLNSALAAGGNAGKVSFTHLIGYAIARAAAASPAMTTHFARTDDGKPARVPGPAHLGLAVDSVRKDGTRSLVVPVIRNAADLPVQRVPRRVRAAHRTCAHQHALRRRAPGRDADAHQSRRHRHGRVGPPVDAGSGNHRRRRRDRLSGRVAHRSRGAASATSASAR